MDGADGHQHASAAATIDAAALEAARFGFHRAFPRRSARRVFHIPQFLAIAGVVALLVWALAHVPAAALNGFHNAALVLFSVMILWRLVAAAGLTPVLSRIGEPVFWPTYTILCPLYREANVAPDLIAALDHLDYPGLMHQVSKVTPLSRSILE